MKGIKYFFVIAIALLMIVPFSVCAEDSKEVTIYFFRGEGCSHCAEFEDWLEEIEEEYGQYFAVKDYETWYNEDNQELMQKVAEARDEEASGVPYIIIGDKSWNGFADEYKEEILDEIATLYDKDVSERYDIMKYVDGGKKVEEKDDTAGSIIAVAITVLVLAGITFGLIKAKKNVK